MNLHLVTNPGSRQGRGRRLADEYARRLEARGVPFTRSDTTSLDDAERQAWEAIVAGATTVAAVGGDGTINRVLRAFFDDDRPGADVRLGVLYAGTSPDFCRYHAIPTEPAAAVETLLRGRVTRIDVARMRYHDATDGERTAHFACSANLGLGAGIARRSNRLRRFLGDFLGTLTATLVTVLRTPPRALRLSIDDRTEDGTRVLNVTVGKNPWLASGLNLGVETSADDGRLYCFVVRGVSRFGLLRRLPAFYSGAAGLPPFLLRTDAREVTVASAHGPLACECDGDPAGFGPVTITVLPRALSLIGGRP